MSETSAFNRHGHAPAERRTRLPAILLAFALTLLSLTAAAQSPTEALFQAVELNDLDAVTQAIEAGADLSAKNAQGMTPADVAVDLGHFRIAHALLAKRSENGTKGPRVTEKGTEALSKPRARVAPPAPRPDPRITELVPPKKPAPASPPPAMTPSPPAVSQPMPSAPAPSAEAMPSVPQPETEMPAVSPPSEDMPAIGAPPPPDLATPPPLAPLPEPTSPTAPAIQPRPDDEMATAEPKTMQPAPAPPAESEGFLGSIVGGIGDLLRGGPAPSSAPPPRKDTMAPEAPPTPQRTPAPAPPPKPQVAEAPPSAPAPPPEDKPMPAAPVAPTPEDRAIHEAPAGQETTFEGGGELGSLMDSLKNIVTLGGLLGGNEPQSGDTRSGDTAASGRTLRNPADRFSSSPTSPESESAAGRMVDRMRDMVGEQPKENFFGLPEAPVVAPPPVETAERAAPPPLAEPTLPGTAEAMPGLPEIVPPSDDGGPAVGVPGLETPAVPAPGAADSGIEVPGLPSDLGAPAVPPAAEGGEPSVPGLPPGLEMPGVAPPAPMASSEEVPGILPPPGTTGEAMPSLPPGLEPLPGAEDGRLRRPGGLVEPEDPAVLPPPSGSIAERLARMNELLNRNPDRQTDRYGTVGDRAKTPAPPRTAPAKPPVTSAPADPMLEIPKGLEDRRTVTAPSTQRRQPQPGDRDPLEILRRAKESEAIQKERERFVRQGGETRIETKPDLEPSRHALQQPEIVITEREKPGTRLFDRLSNLGKPEYGEEDIHGLPVKRAPVDGRKEPVKDVTVAELPQARQEQADGKIRALARFFTGDQEEEQGMQPPPGHVQTEAIPRIVDNLIPENDPARGRVVDDRLLDLSGVERQPEQAMGQPGASPSGPNTRVEERFLDKLTEVLGPAQKRVRPEDVPPPEQGRVGLEELNVPQDQVIPPPKPDIPDPWTMTIEKSDAGGESKTLGVSAISPEDGSEIQTEQGVVTQMVSRIRQLLGSPEKAASGARTADQLDAEERQEAAEKLLSEALRDGAPTALPDAGAWPVTDVETSNAPPGVPPQPRPGALSRTSLQDVILSLGESVTLENTLPPQQDGVDPLNECIKKNRGTTLFCVEPVDWPTELQPVFVVPTILYTGPMAITRYDQGTPSRFHALFSSDDFEDVVAYYQARYGEPTEIWKRSIAPLAKPRMDNPTVTWRSRDSKSNVVTVLEIRKFDDSRGGFPDTNRGAVMLYHLNAPSIFPQVSSHELMRLRRTR